MARVKKKVCHACKGDRMRWTCRRCGAICCEHRCSNKTQGLNVDKANSSSVTRYRIATCGACRIETSRLAPQ